MLNFLTGSPAFALAVLAAAAGPVIIHLLNRRRFRVVNWAAMDFLLEALQRNRKILQLRDLLLLALRTACILLFGLALARPYFASSDATVSQNEPLHAVMVIDNSLSMGYEKLDHTLLDEAKAKAKEFVEDLPEGSRISVLPLCGSTVGFSRDAYRTKEDVRDAIDRIEVVDRSGDALQAADLARQACQQVPDMANKRVVFLGDQQLVNWPAESLTAQLKELPEMQVVSLAAEDPENTWIEDFTLQDGIADIETPAVFKVVLHHKGSTPRNNVQVTLSIDGSEVASQTVDLLEDQQREVMFEYRFDIPAEPGKPVFVPAKVTIPADHLPADDARYLSVPVVAALPVVFVDQYGADEDPAKNRYGETRQLRTLLAPRATRGGAERHLVRIEHLTIEQLDREVLQDARLVVIAGVNGPAPGSVELLREYVEQGGQLVIAAGGDFDPAAWTQAAWRQGGGILPLPLKPQPIGSLPEEATQEIKPFTLSFASMAHDYFHLASTSRAELEDLYSLPYFFKAVEADINDEIIVELIQSEAKRIAQQRQVQAEADEQLEKWADMESRGTLTETDRQARDALRQKLAEANPSWLLWAQSEPGRSLDDKPENVAAQFRPRILAAFDNQLPFLVERKLGRGHVLFVASGTFSSWNTLPKTNTVLLFDRILRAMLWRTFPPRNLASVEQVTLPVVDRNATYQVSRPDGLVEPLSIDAQGEELYGVTIRNLTTRGIYKVAATSGDPNSSAATEARLWEIPLAVNGPSRESDPTLLDEAGLKDRVGDANYKWIAPGAPISLEGAAVSGQNLWKWLIGLVLACLLLELGVLARPMLAKERAA